MLIKSTLSIINKVKKNLYNKFRKTVETNLHLKFINVKTYSLVYIITNTFIWYKFDLYKTIAN